MLEHAPAQNETAPNLFDKKTNHSRFFEYANVHREEGVESCTETAKVVLEALQSSEGTFFEDVGAMYPLIHERLLVRRENVEIAMGGILKEENISIDPKGLYPNVAWWDIAHGSEGLKNAFLEGRAHMNGVVAVLGFKPSEHIAVVEQKDIPDEPSIFRGADGVDLDRRFVASAHGTVSPDDIRFAIFRFPYQYFPEKEMTDDEVLGGDKNPNGKLQYIFRGVYLGHQGKSTLH